MKIPSTLTRAAMLLSVGACLVSSLGAVTINFNTSSSCFAANFGGTTCSSSPGVLLYSGTGGDSATLSFAPTSSTVVVPPNTSSNIGYGVFTLTFTGNNGQLITNIAPETFILDVVQTAPYAYSYGEISVTISGPNGGVGYVGLDSSNLQATFNPLSVGDGETVYSLVPALQLIPESHSNGGALTIQGQVITTGVPEPKTITLMALSLGLFGFAMTRRRKISLPNWFLS